MTDEEKAVMMAIGQPGQLCAECDEVGEPCCSFPCQGCAEVEVYLCKGCCGHDIDYKCDSCMAQVLRRLHLEEPLSAN